MWFLADFIEIKRLPRITKFMDEFNYQKNNKISFKKLNKISNLTQKKSILQNRQTLGHS